VNQSDGYLDSIQNPLKVEPGSQYRHQAVISRMKQASGLQKDSELARFLNTTTSAVSSWKNAKNPPFSACYQCSSKTGVSMDWLLWGQLRNPIPPRNLGESKLQTGNELVQSALQEHFIENYIEIIRIGYRLGYFPAQQPLKVEHLATLAKALFNESIQDVLTTTRLEESGL